MFHRCYSSFTLVGAVINKYEYYTVATPLQRMLFITLIWTAVKCFTFVVAYFNNRFH